MGLIYSLASRVVAWLGPEGQDSKLAVSTLRILGKQLNISNGYWRFNSASADEPELFYRSFVLPYNFKTWEAVNAFYSRE